MLKVTPSEVVTDAAAVYPAVLDELIPSAWHHVERYANNPIEADHSQLKHRLRPMRGLRTDRTAQVIIAGHAFMQNLRRGHYELAIDSPVAERVAAAFTELVQGDLTGAPAPVHCVRRSLNATAPVRLLPSGLRPQPGRSIPRYGRRDLSISSACARVRLAQPVTTGDESHNRSCGSGWWAPGVLRRRSRIG